MSFSDEGLTIAPGEPGDYMVPVFHGLTEGTVATAGFTNPDQINFLRRCS